jgi:hypothetical protein
LELRILEELWAHFAELRILKNLAEKGRGLGAAPRESGLGNYREIVAMEKGKETMEWRARRRGEREEVANGNGSRERRVVGLNSKHMMPRWLMAVKDNYLVIRMTVSGRAQVCSSGTMERSCERGAIRMNCGNLWRTSEPHEDAPQI